ncbi:MULTISPECIES: hypothetical protein [unclassified Microbacterium]|nr:hypothetical protein [Microbacterium sp. ABRD28]
MSRLVSDDGAAQAVATVRRADDTYAPRWWSPASPDDHGVDIASWTDTFD